MAVAAEMTDKAWDKPMSPNVGVHPLRPAVQGALPAIGSEFAVQPPFRVSVAVCCDLVRIR